jgi:carbamoylphosphate synthase large subunit
MDNCPRAWPDDGLRLRPIIWDEIRACRDTTEDRVVHNYIVAYARVLGSSMMHAYGQVMQIRSQFHSSLTRQIRGY